jgi:Glycosyl transferase family 11
MDKSIRNTKKSMAYLCLHGGIGNQLFQINKCLNLYPEYVVVIQDDTEKTGIIWANSVVGIFSKPISYNSMKAKFLFIVSRYIFHFENNPMSMEKIFPFKTILRLVIRTTLLLFFRQKVSIVSDTFHTKIEKNQKTFLSGYFQNSMEKQILKNHSISPFMSRELESKIDIANSTRPIIIHVRLGDYLTSQIHLTQEPDYYLSALNIIEKDLPSSPIWVFSNDIPSARLIFEHLINKDITYIGRIDDSDVQTLELMRYGSAYIISNSTFSWWAALNSYTLSPNVIAPKLWFRGQTNFSIDLPKDWITI